MYLERARAGTAAKVISMLLVEIEEQYLYHVTGKENIDDIRHQGLLPHPPSFRDEQDAWPDGGTEPRVYFARDEKTAMNFSEPGHAMIRIRLQDLQKIGLKKEPYTGDFYVRRKVPSQMIEVVLTEAKDKSRFLYHGTSSCNLKSILKSGIQGPSYWGSTPEMAMYYAEGEVDNEAPPWGRGTKDDYPVIFRVPINRLGYLNPDRAAAQEPITTVLGKSQRQIQKEWNRSPQDAAASIDILGSVKCNGDVKVSKADIFNKTNAMVNTRGQDAFNAEGPESDTREEDEAYPVPLPP